MEQITLNFTANEQNLVIDGGVYEASPDTIAYFDAVFDLGDNWSGFDSVRAVWFNDFNTISTVLDSDGACTVPMEVLKRKCKVYVNLVGSVSENGVVTDRLTTYPINAITINAKSQTTGSETAEITASQFEQYIAQVSSLVASVKDIDSVVLNADYTLTINFSDGTSTTTTSIRGEQGATGERGETGATGATGATGNGIASIAKTGTSGLVDTYTISMTDGTAFSFTVTNGDDATSLIDRILPEETVSGAIASFTDGTDVVSAKSVVIDIDAVQSGSGDPSPNNVRPISGWASAKVVVSPTQDAQDGTTYTIDLDGTRYGGTLDVVSGVMTVTHGIAALDGSEQYADYWNIANTNRLGVYISGSETAEYTDFVCSHYKICTYGTLVDNGISKAQGGNTAYILKDSTNAITLNGYKSYVAQQYANGTPVTLAYKLATPTTVQLTPQQIDLLLGDNNVWADCGDTEVTYKADIQRYIAKEIANA